MSKIIQDIIVKFITNQASFSELDELEIWIQDSANEKLFNAYIKTDFAIEYNMRKFNSDKVKKELLEVIANERKTIKLKKTREIFRYVAAAIVIGILTTTYFFENNISNTSVETTPIIVNTNTNIIEPGSDKATLTLEDGSVVKLEKGNNYQTQNINSNGQQIVYKAEKQNPSEVTYNYLTIPRGGQFFIELSDGTQVWLNSESQLKYPVSFKEGETRQVELVYGEAYFDVSPSTEHKGDKFKVLNQSQEVEVVGTVFNIKAYKDETKVYTTLVEGKVTIDNGVSKQNLIPNQQSIININQKGIEVKTIDIYSETSWRNGIFSFKNKPLKEIMVVLSRWYDINVEFDNPKLEKNRFTGLLSKKMNIEEILLTIKKTKFINAYDITNKKITIK